MFCLHTFYGLACNTREISSKNEVGWMRTRLECFMQPFVMLRKKMWIICSFNCLFSSSIWSRILQKCEIRRNCLSWRREVSWFSRKATRKSLTAKARRVDFLGSIYYIWQERNVVIFKQERANPKRVMQRIRMYVKLKLGRGESSSNNPNIASWEKWN